MRIDRIDRINEIRETAISCTVLPLLLNLDNPVNLVSLALYHRVGARALTPRDARLIGGLFDIVGDRFGDSSVEDGGDDVVGV